MNLSHYVAINISQTLEKVWTIHLISLADVIVDQEPLFYVQHSYHYNQEYITIATQFSTPQLWDRGDRGLSAR